MESWEWIINQEKLSVHIYVSQSLMLGKDKKLVIKCNIKSGKIAPRNIVFIR